MNTKSLAASPLYFALALFAMLTASCTTPSATPALLASRLSPEWIATAQRIRSGDRTVYYHGRARGTLAANRQDWAGTVNGEILALDKGMAVVIPAGSLTLKSGGGVKILGQHSVITSDSPSWHHLLLP